MMIPAVLVALLVVSMPLAAASPAPTPVRPAGLDLSLPPDALAGLQEPAAPPVAPAARAMHPVDAAVGRGAELPYGYGYEARQAGRGSGRAMGRGRRR